MTDHAAQRPYPRAEHRVTVSIDSGYYPSAKVECDGTDESFCHLSCPHGCEMWSDDQAWPCGPEDAPHTLESVEFCLVVESLEAAGVMDCHTGPEQEVPGPRALIEPEWDEGYVWRFATVGEGSRTAGNGNGGAGDVSERADDSNDAKGSS